MSGINFIISFMKILSFNCMKGGRAVVPAAFFFVLLCLLSVPLGAEEAYHQKPTAVEEPAKTIADASKPDRERVGAARLLAESDDPKALDPLVAVISNQKENPLLRAAIVHALVKSPQKPLVAAFIKERLADEKESPEVRAAAASALGQLPPLGSKEVLSSASMDSHPQVRQAARSALLMLGGEVVDSANLLIAILQDAKQRAAVRANAARQLGELKDMRALQPLILALGEKSPDIPKPQTAKDFFDLHSLVKRHLPASAARALGRLGSHDAVSPLLSLVHTTDDEFRLAIFEALAMLKTPKAAPIAKTAIISDADFRVRRWAGVILKDAADKESLPVLLKALNDTDAGVRLQAAQAIGDIRDCSAIKDLKKALGQEENKEVRNSMEKALQGIKETKISCEVDLN